MENVPGSHPANALSRSQEVGFGRPKPSLCPSIGSTPNGEMTKSESMSDNARVRNNDGEKCKTGRMTNVEMMREMQIAESDQMSVEKKKIDAREKRREKGHLKQREEADRNRKKNKMMDWLVRRNMDDELSGEMMDGSQDVALNFADVVGGMV